MSQKQTNQHHRMVERLLRHGITFRPVDDSPEDWAQVRQLVQRVYIEELGLPSQVQHDPYARLGNSYLALKAGEAVGTIRVISQHALEQLQTHQLALLPHHGTRPLLPMESYFPLAEYIQPGERVAEGGRLIVHPDYRQSSVALGLMALPYYHGQYERLDKMFCLINHVTLGMYEKCGYQPLDEPRYVDPYRHYSVPIMISANRIPPQFSQLSEYLLQAGIMTLPSQTLDNTRMPRSYPLARPRSLWQQSTVLPCEC